MILIILREQLLLQVFLIQIMCLVIWYHIRYISIQCTFPNRSALSVDSTQTRTTLLALDGPGNNVFENIVFKANSLRKKNQK